MATIISVAKCYNVIGFLQKIKKNNANKFASL